MDMTGTQKIEAKPEVVWTALLDPEVLKDCIPGCTALEGSPEEGYTATVTQKVGPVKATFNGAVQLTNIRPGEGCKIEGSGKAGPAGHASGSADVSLSPDGDGTTLDYAVEAKVGGKIAQLGSRIVDGVARRLADKFFENFKEKVEGPAAEVTADAAPSPASDAAAEEAASTADGTEPKKGFLKRVFRN